MHRLLQWGAEQAALSAPQAGRSASVFSR